MEALQEIWASVLEYFRKNYKIPDIAFDLFFKEITLEGLDIEKGRITLCVLNKIHVDTINKNYKEQLGSSIEAIFGSPLEIILVERKDLEKKDEEVSPEDNLTFDTFIVGGSNKLAHAAAYAVAQKPGQAYNPLFIYGNPGLGKTHLLKAIGNEIKKSKPDAVINYIKGDMFTNELIEAIAKDSTTDFHNKYCSADILLVDDVQFIGGKTSTQEEFFHTFNALYEDKKQIVLTSDRPPKEISTLEERIKSRFEWGIIADIQPPDLEMRIAIILRKADEMNIEIPNDVATYIAERIKNNIRQLEGVVKKLHAKKQLTNISPSITAAQESIEDIINDDQPAPEKIQKIIEEVARTFNITAEDILSTKQTDEFVKPRHVAIYIALDITDKGVKYVADYFGKTHSTAIYSRKKVEDMMKTDKELRNTVKDIIKNVSNS